MADCVNDAAQLEWNRRASTGIHNRQAVSVRAGKLHPWIKEMLALRPPKYLPCFGKVRR